MLIKCRALLLALFFPFLYSFIQITVRLGGQQLFFASWRAQNSQADEQALLQALQNYLAENGLWLLLIAALIAIGAAVFALWRQYRAGLFQPGKPPGALPVALLVGCGVSLLVLTNLVLSYLLQSSLVPEIYKTEHDMLTGALVSQGPVMTFLVSGLVVPAAEELLFRGLCYRSLRGAFSVRFAIVLQALIFAGFHQNPLQILYAFPVALVLGLVYEWSGSLLAPILLHMAFNNGNQLLALLPEGDAPGAGMVWTTVVLTSMLLAVVCIRQLYARRVESR